MVKELNREQFLDNLMYQVGMMGYTASDFEKAIGVYSGYMSRMKSDPQKLPALDIAWKMAQVLEVNLEWLIEGSEPKADEDIDFLFSFLERLFTLTHNREIRWDIHEIWQINEAIANHQLLPELPFLRKATEKSGEPVQIRSLALTDFDAHLMTDVWSTPLDEHRIIWLLSLAGTDSIEPPSPETSPNHAEWIEMIMQDARQPNQISLVCTSIIGDGSFLKGPLKKLLTEVELRHYDPILDQNVKTAIHAFMEKTQPKPSLPEDSRPTGL